MTTTTQSAPYTIRRGDDGRYRLFGRDGEPMRDGLGIVSFGKAAHAADYCAAFGIAYEWHAPDWPGLMQ